MGLANAAVFKMVPKYVPNAVGGASGLVGGFGALGGFVFPPLLGLFAGALGDFGYAGGFFVYVVLAVAAIGVSVGFIRTGTPRSQLSQSFRRAQENEPFPRPADLLPEAGRHLLRRARHRHQRAARLGGRLPQALAARQNRALHPRRELHRLVLVEDLRQGRHRHLGDAADRLSAHPPRPAQPRAARLRPRRQLFLVPVFGQPGEAPDGARPPAEAVARGPRRPLTPVAAWASIVENAGEARQLHHASAASAASSAPTWDEVERDHRRRQRLHGRRHMAPTG